MEYKINPDYPNLTYQNEGIVRNPDNFDDIDVYFMYWSKPNKAIHSMKLIEERMKQNQESWLQAVGPDPK